MEQLINELKELSKKYEHLSNVLGLDDGEEEIYLDNDMAIDEGKSQAYFDVHMELDKLIRSVSSEGKK